MADADPQKNIRSRLFQVDRRTLITNLLFVEVALSVFSWPLIGLVQKQSFTGLVTKGRPIAVQVLIGLLVGGALAVLVSLTTLKGRTFDRLQRFLREVLNHFRPTNLDIVIVSLAAGLGEELFFRAALQPLVGIWLASLLFMLVHLGMIKSLSALLAYAALAFVMGLFLGLVFERVGLVAAIILHGTYDMIVLFAAKHYLQEKPAQLLTP